MVRAREKGQGCSGPARASSDFGGDGHVGFHGDRFGGVSECFDDGGDEFGADLGVDAGESGVDSDEVLDGLEGGEHPGYL